MLLARTLCAALAALVLIPAAHAEPVPEGTEHVFEISNFRTESGSVLPKARVVYATFGTLNARGDNVVLVPSHYMADWHGYDWLIGADKALDPATTFIVATGMFGNGRSSSPSNTPAPFDGPRFPVTTIRDNVEASLRLLRDGLGVRHLRAVVGFSMGGQQAFQWALSHPEFTDRAVVTAATAKTYGHGVVRLESQIAAITADPAFAGGDYKIQPAKGLEAFNLVWTAWLYSQEWWRRELWREGAKPDVTFAGVLDDYRRNFIPGADANNLILQMRAWEAHDIAKTPGHDGDIGHALAAIRIPVLYMPSTTDLYFPLDDARYEAGFNPRITLKPVVSLWGHPAGAGASAADARFLNTEIKAFLAAPVQ